MYMYISTGKYLPYSYVYVYVYVYACRKKGWKVSTLFKGPRFRPGPDTVFCDGAGLVPLERGEARFVRQIEKQIDRYIKCVHVISDCVRLDVSWRR